MDLALSEIFTPGNALAEAFLKIVIVILNGRIFNIHFISFLFTELLVFENKS